jgi:hypothetical protein
MNLFCAFAITVDGRTTSTGNQPVPRVDAT